MNRSRTRKPRTRSAFGRFFLSSFFSFVAGLLHAQTASYSNDFLSIGIDAAALGQGGAYVARSQGTTAGYWNPAGVVGLSSDFAAASMHAEYFMGMALYDHLGLALRADSLHAIAFNLVRFGVDDIPNTLALFDNQGNLDYTRISQFSVADYALWLSVARRLANRRAQVGASLKLIYRHQGGFASAWGVGLDVGAQWQFGDWHFGLVLRDISTTISLWSFDQQALALPYDTLGLSNPVPASAYELALPSAQIGIARRLSFGQQWQAQIELDTDVYSGQRNELIRHSLASLNLRSAIEISFQQRGFVRLGVSNFQRVRSFGSVQKLRVQPSLGIGFRYRSVALDYALGNVARAGGGAYSNYLSVQYVFNSKPRSELPSGY